MQQVQYVLQACFGLSHKQHESVKCLGRPQSQAGDLCWAYLLRSVTYH